MSYALSAPLQAAVYQALSDDNDLMTLVGPAIYDAIPSGTLPPLYVTLGPETVQDASDKTGSGAVHQFTISVITDAPGFAAAKEAAAAVSDILHDGALTLSRGRLVSLLFERAVASRIDGATGRKIDLRFRARVEDD
ncbi:DUF3168 domain-containing protein [Pseudosulfitobacter sp. SM2401]|uniref:DUF3168 domain-containing protein n=1 Tax=Pseudosulfitobacter sp. SM2401 TaxID=3350098 RepID=UPI0036F407E2